MPPSLARAAGGPWRAIKRNSRPGAVSGGFERRSRKAKPAVLPDGGFMVCFFCGSYRDRTDDIHGVNVALYQLS